MDGPTLSLIVPMYNESLRAAGPLREMGEFLARQGYPSELVLVDDGSDDGTAELVRELAPTLHVPTRLLGYPGNRGKGYALKVGFAAARGQWLLFSDVDLSTPLRELPRFLERLAAGADVVIGSRRTRGSLVAKRQPLFRELLGSVFTLLVRALIADASDVTCGFKAFRREAGKELFARTLVHDWSFDAEILLIAKRLGYVVEELPVHWEDREGTKVHVVRDVFNSLVGIARIRLHDLMGRYEGVSEEPLTQVWSAEFDPARHETPS